MVNITSFETELPCRFRFETTKLIKFKNPTRIRPVLYHARVAHKKKQSRKKSGSAKTYVKDLFAFLAVTSAAVTPAAVGTSATAVLASLCMSIGSHACVR